LLFALTGTKPTTPGFEAESQFCPVVVETVTVLIVGATPFSRMLTFWVEKVDPIKLKVTGFGLQVKPPVPPELPTLKITVIVAMRPVLVVKGIIPLYVPAESCVVVVLQPIPAAYVITAPLLVAHSQLPPALVAIVPMVIDEIVVTGDVVTVNVLDAVDPAPAMLRENGLGTTSVCARATSGLLKQTTAANARSSGRRLSVGKCFSPNWI